MLRQKYIAGTHCHPCALYVNEAVTHSFKIRLL